MAMEEAKERFGSVISYAEDVITCVETADTAVLATPWEEFRTTTAYATDSIVLIDLWRALTEEAVSSATEYISPGT